MERTIKNLSQMNGKVYVYLANAEIGNQFLRSAENEGFRFGDGAKPTSRNYAEIMAVNKEQTINFVGSNGRIAFGSNAKIAGQSLIRIDYEKYAAGAEDYYYSGKHA